VHDTSKCKNRKSFAKCETKCDFFGLNNSFRIEKAFLRRGGSCALSPPLSLDRGTASSAPSMPPSPIPLPTVFPEIVFSTDDSLYISHFSKEEKTFSSLSEEECDGDVYRLWNLWRKLAGFVL